MKRLFPILLNSLLIMLIILLFSFSLLNFLSAPARSGLLGFKGYTVLSDSMLPTFKAGDYIIDRTIPYNELEKGMIISYND